MSQVYPRTHIPAVTGAVQLAAFPVAASLSLLHVLVFGPDAVLELQQDARTRKEGIHD